MFANSNHIAPNKNKIAGYLLFRYKYLQKPLEDSSLPTLLQYANKWDPEKRDRFAVAIGLIIAQGLAGTACLQSLTKDHLIKNGTVPNSLTPSPCTQISYRAVFL